MGKRRDSFEAVQKSVARVKDINGQTWGTGFFISREGHLLTCAHVVQDAGGWKNVRILDQPITCLYEGDPERDDFCLLQVEDVQVTPVELGKDFDPGDEFLSFGFSNEDFYGAPIRGEITAFARCGKLGDQKLIRLETFSDAQRIEGGQSGAPVLLYKRGKFRVIGLIAASEDLQGGLAIPAEAISNKVSHIIYLKQKRSNVIKRLTYIGSSLLGLVVGLTAIYLVIQLKTLCSSNSIDSYYEKIKAAFESNQEKQALSYSNELVSKCSDNYLSYIYRGNVFWRFGRLDEAISDFQQASKQNPRSEEAKYNIAIVYRDSNQYEKAIEVLTPLLQDVSLISPKSSFNINDVRFQLGYNYHYTAWKVKVRLEDKISYLARARDLYQQVISNTPTNCCFSNAAENNCCPEVKPNAADQLAGVNAVLYSLTGSREYLRASIDAIELGLRSKTQSKRLSDLKLIESGTEYDIQQQLNLIRSTKEFSNSLPRLRAVSGS